MKLYTNNQGKWAGTQADAKQLGDFEQVEVPTDKPTLLAFLNEYEVGAADVVSAQMEMVQNVTAPVKTGDWAATPTTWQIHDVAAKCSLKDLTRAMAVYLNRIDEELS